MRSLMPPHLSRVRRWTVAVTLGAVAMGGAVALGSGPAAADTVTDYGFAGTAYGTKADAEQVVLKSGRTAYATLGCTRVAGRTVVRDLAAADAPSGNPGLRVGAVHSVARTYKTRSTGRVGTRTTNQLARVVLGDPSGMHMTIRGLSTVADAWATRDSRLHARSTFDSGDISLASGTPLDAMFAGANDTIGDLFDAIRSAPGDVLVVPGIGAFTEGSTSDKAGTSAAISSAIALRVTLYGADQMAAGGDDTRVTIGRAQARILRRLPSGVMRGNAYGLAATALAGQASVGPLAEQPLPCKGTGGQVRSNDAAGLDVGNAGVIRAGTSGGRVYGIQRADRSAKAWTEGRLAGLTLGSGESQVRLRGIVGQANVSRSPSGRLRTSIRGSEIGSLTVGGERRAIPDPGQTLEVPGVARLTFFVKDTGAAGISVVAVRIRLLDGTAGVSTIDAGVAKAAIKRY